MKETSNTDSWYLFATAREYWRKLPAREQARIQAYTRKEIEGLAACTAPPGSKEYWRLRIDAALCLHHHQNPIQRHEAAFALGAFPYQNELERFFAVKHLRYAMRYDSSIVVRHESIEALGSSNTFCVASVGAAADICKINYLWPEWSDVQATAQETFTNILTWIKKDERHKDIVRELTQWWALPRLKIPKEVLTGSLDEAWLTYTQHQKVREKTA